MSNCFTKYAAVLFASVCIVAAAFALVGCEEKTTNRPIDYSKIQKQLILENKKKHEYEIAAIEKFIAEKGWNMQQTPTGLRYSIYEPGSGSTPKLNDVVTISFRVELLDGTKCYETSDADPRQFKIGMDNVESGLHEVLQLMKEGDRCRVILPSYLAFGLTGDSDKIPSDASVLYDLHLIRIN